MPSGRRSYNPFTTIVLYFSVVKRETAHIALTMVVLHDLEVNAEDVLTAFVMALNHEKIWIVLGLSLERTLVNLPKLSKHNMVLRVQVSHLGHILHNTCRNWGISPVMPT